MQPRIFFLPVVGLTLFSCQKVNLVNSVSRSLEGKWRVIAAKENASGFTTTKPSSITGDVDITFSPNNTTGGVLFGNTPSNTIGQNDYLTGINRSITILSLSMTKVMETSGGDEFVGNIRSPLEYSFEVGGNLNIKTPNKTLTSRKL